MILGLNPCISGLNYHDPCACLVDAGRLLIACEEERYIGRKSAPGVFPARSVQECLQFAGISIRQLDGIAIGYSPEAAHGRLDLVRQVNGCRSASATFSSFEAPASDVSGASAAIKGILGIESQSIPIHFVEHHLAHAASCLLPTTFSEGIGVVWDGVGEIDCSSIWLLKGGRIERLKTQTLPNSLGYLYAALTDYLGFEAFEGEGKTMALAPYGVANSVLERAAQNLLAWDGEQYDCRKFISKCLLDDGMLDLIASKRVLRRYLGTPARKPGEPLNNFHRGVAAAIQGRLENVAAAYVASTIRSSGVRYVGLAGGVALNCKVNGVIRSLPEVQRLYVPPFPADAGTAIGAAWLIDYEMRGTRPVPLESSTIGPISASLAPKAASTEGVINDKVARTLSDGAIVMWFAGRSEVGPRALGARSILADPSKASTAHRLNKLVKGREAWRPFGASILEEFGPEVILGLEKTEGAVLMGQTYAVADVWRDKVPGVVHPVDGSTRPQLVSRRTQPRYWDLITRFKGYTGIPMLVNTSLNAKGQPLIKDLEDCEKLFRSSAADLLVADGVLIQK